MGRRATPVLYGTLLACLGAASLWGCDDKAGEALALKEGLAAAREAGRVKPLSEAPPDTGARLEAALDRNFPKLVSQLGPVKMTVEGRYTLELEGNPEVALVESLVLEIDREGQFRLIHKNVAADGQDGRKSRGRRCWRVDGKGYTARLSGPATTLETPGQTLDMCLATTVEPMTGLVALLSDHLNSTPAERSTVANRDALTVVLSRAGEGTALPPPVPMAWPEPRDPTLARYGLDAEGNPAPRPPLVATHTEPVDLRGTLKLDVQTGDPLKGSFEGTLIATKFDARRTLRFEVKIDTVPFNGELKPPVQTRLYGARQRLFQDCEVLLGKGGCLTVADDEVVLPKPGDAPALKIQSDGEDADEPVTPEKQKPRRRKRRRKRR